MVPNKVFVCRLFILKIKHVMHKLTKELLGNSVIKTDIVKRLSKNCIGVNTIFILNIYSEYRKKCVLTWGGNN